ncbi:MAG TPA: translation elongation factor Ts [Patescibacteria group bacterium]
MATFSMDTLKQLREETGFGIMDIKKALEQADGDMAKARDLLKEKSAMVVAKKADRETKQGLIHTYAHLGKIGAMVEVNCETDFVARNDDFKTFVKDLTLHIASMNPADLDELMSQPFFSDEKVTVRQLLDQMVGKIGENIQIRRFARFELGAE